MGTWWRSFLQRKPHPAVRAFGDVREYESERDETDMKREMEGR